MGKYVVIEETDKLDFEYKKYELLAYFKNVKNDFNKLRIYPHLDDLDDLKLYFTQCLSDIKQIRYDIHNQNFLGDFYTSPFISDEIIGDENLLNELEKICLFGVNEVRKIIKEGKIIFDFVEDMLDISEIGEAPLYDLEGYLLVKNNKFINIYRYDLTNYGVESKRTGYPSMSLKLIDVVEEGSYIDYHEIKMNLEKSFPNLPNPSTYFISSTIDLPFKSTYLSVVKKILAKRLSLNI